MNGFPKLSVAENNDLGAHTPAVYRNHESSMKRELESVLRSIYTLGWFKDILIDY